MKKMAIINATGQPCPCVYGSQFTVVGYCKHHYTLQANRSNPKNEVGDGNEGQIGR